MISKEFKIQQLSDKEEYIIDEYLNTFGLIMKTKYHSADGINGDIPFKYDEVKSKIGEFEQLEEFESVYREGTFNFILMLVLSFIIIYYTLS